MLARNSASNVPMKEGTSDGVAGAVVSVPAPEVSGALAGAPPDAVVAGVVEGAPMTVLGGVIVVVVVVVVVEEVVVVDGGPGVP